MTVTVPFPGYRGSGDEPGPRYGGTYRAAVIGHTGRGGYGHGLDTAFLDLPGVRVVAVADPDDGGRAAAVARTGAARGYADYRALLERERPDLVAVSPGDLDEREAMVVSAALSGARAIYCEKPLARSLDEADRMLEACTSRRVKLAVAHQNRGFPAPRLVGRLIAAGRIGTLRRMRGWPKQDRRGGGLELLIHGTHMFDLMRLFAGEARWGHARVTCGGRDATAADAQLAPPAAHLIAGDDVVAEYGFGGGVLGQYESMRSDDGGGSTYLHMEVSGSAGTVAFWSDLASPVYYSPRAYPLPDTPNEWQRLEPPVVPVPVGRSKQHSGNQWLVRDLLAAVEEDRQPHASGEDARGALEMVLGAYESHLRGGRVRLPLVRRDHPLARWAADDAAKAGAGTEAVHV